MKCLQGRGCGKSAARLAIGILKAADPEKTIKLSTGVCNTRAQGLFGQKEAVKNS